MSNQLYPFIVIGGGAAGFFSAITAKQANPDHPVILLEKHAQLLSKVRVSGGGRCNVTHSCFEPKELTQNYPRGSKELLGPFNKFQPKDTISWFQDRGVELKVEPDGRMFPTTDSSETIIHCLMHEARSLGVDIRTQQKIESIKKDDTHFTLLFSDGTTIQASKLILATGSAPQGHLWAQSFGHQIVDPVPSLFTLNVPKFPLVELAGIAVTAQISLKGTSFNQTAPLLITHWGFSGPAALKLSAWAARSLHAQQYKAELSIDWTPSITAEKAMDQLLMKRKEAPNQQIGTYATFDLPKNLWKKLLERAGLDPIRKWIEISNGAMTKFIQQLKGDLYIMEGKTTHKEEFVTCGGVSLKEINFKTMESKLCPGLFFAGEILDVDAVTGGFNFQNAWTTGWIAGTSIGNTTD